MQAASVCPPRRPSRCGRRDAEVSGAHIGLTPPEVPHMAEAAGSFSTDAAVLTMASSWAASLRPGASPPPTALIKLIS